MSTLKKCLKESAASKRVLLVIRENSTIGAAVDFSFIKKMIVQSGVVVVILEQQFLKRAETALMLVGQEPAGGAQSVFFSDIVLNGQSGPLYITSMYDFARAKRDSHCVQMAVSD